MERAKTKQTNAAQRLAVWGINYAPEVIGIAPYNQALCEFLREKGYAVETVTTFSYYPFWQKRPEDHWLLYRKDYINRIPVHRCWHYVPKKVRALKRILHEASFVIASTIRMLTLKRFDLMIVVSPPLLLGAAAWLVSWVKKSRFVFHVQDLQPDAAVGLGMVQKGVFTKLLYVLESFSYRKASVVSGISEGMLRAFQRKGVPVGKTIYFPNGIRIPDLLERPVRGLFRADQQLKADDFIVVYSGNLGIKQGLKILIKAAGHLKVERIKIVINGDGAERLKLEQMIDSTGVRNVMLLPLRSEKEYGEMLVDADLCVVTQQKGSGGFFFPSKLLSILSFGRPVLSVADDESELARAGREHGFSVNVPPDQPEMLARTMEMLAGDRDTLDRKSRAGFEFVQRFEMQKVLADFQRSLQPLLGKAADAEMRCASSH